AELHAGDPSGGFAREAYAIAQRGRARSLLDLLAESEVDLRIHADPAYRERETALLDDIAEQLRRLDAAPDSAAFLSAETARLEQDLDLLGGELHRVDPRYGEIRYARPPELADVQAAILAPDELLLEYIVAEESSFLWVVTTNSLALHRLPPRGRLAPVVREVLEMLGDYNIAGADPAYFVEPVEELSQWLLSDAAPDLQRYRRVIVVAHDILNYLPFEVLFARGGPESPQSTPANARGFAALPFLVYDHDILYVPSVAVLGRLRERSAEQERARSRAAMGDSGPGSSRILLVGDPDCSDAQGLSVFARAGLGETAPPLPDAHEELSRIASLFPPAQTTRLEGRAANLHALRDAAAQPHDYLHFAVHGIFNERRPRYSGLLLSRAPGDEDDGYLTLDEAFGLDLPCRQVVLSACASALGEDVRGEGLLGLTQAFFYSGTETVVASLWPVAGEATARFMRIFYEELLAAPIRDRASALAEAKRRMLEEAAAADHPALDTAHPFFWAPFILIGSPGTKTGG
ncbi:MAG: CHAT domain-containing protein, partial [Candidatus Eisenbacteria bacterium]